MKPPEGEDPSEWLMREMGAALVVWSEIEGEWGDIFVRLLFYDRFVPPPDAMGDEYVSPEVERANAVWDSQLSSKGQLDMVAALAPIVLTLPEQATGLKRMTDAIARTNDLRGLRNAIAHGPFRQAWRYRFGPSGGIIISKPRVELGPRPHKRMRGKDPYEEIPKMHEQFRNLLTEASAIRMWMILKRWIDK